MKNKFTFHILFFSMLFSILLIPVSGVGAATGTPLETVSCGGMNMPSQLLVFSRAVMLLIQIAVPVILIILGMLDFAKATIGSDEAAIKEARGKFMKRLIAGAVVFLVFVIIKLVIQTFPTGATDSVINCFECFIKDTGNC